MTNKTETAVFGGGCFWCTEAVFGRLKGVISAIPGYAGGITEHPTYDEVCAGNTGHAEVVRIEYSPEQISFNDLLTIFFSIHDPTTINRQGDDVGSQYRSIILCTSDKQAMEAKKFIKTLDESGCHGRPAVTEIKPLKKFSEAENYHQKYYQTNTDKPYCRLVINPKLEKFRKRHANLLKEPPKV